MARPKFPKKNNGAQDLVSTTSPQPSNTNIAPAEAAVPVPETKMAAPRTPPARKTARMPEIVKTEPRANLVPINLEDEIRRLAYLLSERRGFQPGHEAEDWLAAEHEVRQRYHQQSA